MFNFTSCVKFKASVKTSSSRLLVVVCVPKPANHLLTNHHETFLECHLKHRFSYLSYSKINTFSNASETSVWHTAVRHLRRAGLGVVHLGPESRTNSRAPSLLYAQSGASVSVVLSPSQIISQKNMYWLSIALLRPLTGGSSS